MLSKRMPLKWNIDSPASGINWSSQPPMSIVSPAYICKNRVLSGAEAAGCCCCVKITDTNIDIKDETVGTTAGSIKISPYSGA